MPAEKRRFSLITWTVRKLVMTVAFLCSIGGVPAPETWRYRIGYNVTGAIVYAAIRIAKAQGFLVGYLTSVLPKSGTGSDRRRKA
jgi:hypothetical protein